MRIIFFVLMIFMFTGCVEWRCYSNTDYAEEQARKFCAQAKEDKTLCESLKFMKNACQFFDDKKICMPRSDTIEAFIRIPYAECQKNLDKKTCSSKEACDWSFNDPLEMSYADYEHR